MTFKQLRNKISNSGKPQIIEWLKSGIIEVATLELNGAVRITNVVSKHSYVLPRKYTQMEIRLVNKNELVQLGKLLPKS